MASLPQTAPLRSLPSPPEPRAFADGALSIKLSGIPPHG